MCLCLRFLYQDLDPFQKFAKSSKTTKTIVQTKSHRIVQTESRQTIKQVQNFLNNKENI